MITVFISSPFRGQRTPNLLYAKRCALHSISLGECPIIPHLMYPSFMQDHMQDDRELAMRFCEEWIKRVDLVAFYTDFGLSEGMILEADWCIKYLKQTDKRDIGVD